MSTCPNCETINKANAEFCVACGNNLRPGKQKGHPIPSSDQIGGIPTQELDQNIADISQAIDNSLLAFKFEQGGDILPLPGTGDFILGRVSEGQTILPDIDLGPYDALEAGVSRIHALIRLSAKAASITDLGSSNGTYVNQQQIAQHVEHVIENKDMIRLGRLKMQALLQIPS